MIALAVLGLAIQPGPSAVEQARDLELKAQAAVKAGDQKARIAADLELYHLLNGSPGVLEALARAYAASGDADEAMARLNDFAALGLSDDGLISGSDRRLAALSELTAYKQVLAQLKKNEAPVSLGTLAYTLADAGILPEDMDYDASSRSFLMTSVLERKIVRLRPNGSLADFATAPDGWPMAAIKVDAARRRVWATEVAFDGLASVPQEAWGRSAVLCFDMRGKLLQRIEGPAHSALADMVLTATGDPLISDGMTGTIYRVLGGHIEPINTTDFISPQTAALDRTSGSLLIPDYDRGIGRFDLKTGSVSWLNQDDADRVAVSGIDGLYLYQHWLIATQNGTAPERVMLFELDGEGKHIVASRVIEQSLAGGTDPTHGVVVGKVFYYVANSGWAQLDDHGNVKPGAKLTGARIMRFALP